VDKTQVSANVIHDRLIEDMIEAEKQKQWEFLNLAERFRNATDPQEVKRLGDQLGRIVFGG
jgi:hypothetical protein